MGWTTVPPQVEGEKVVILGVPHTSIWDFLVGYLYYRSYGRKMRTMIKKEAFIWPLSWILRSMGGFPVDRSNSTKLMVNIIHEMEKPGQFHLVICPEGTRKPVKKWKTGYHTIAKQTGCPVYMGYFDWKKKEVSIPYKLELTDDARKDTDRLQEVARAWNLTGKIPENFIA